DIVFLSMLVSKDHAHALSGTMYEQRFNVAASRARDRLYLVRSMQYEELSPKDLRRTLVAHFQAPFQQEKAELVAGRRNLCESDFEREVFDELVTRGYRVRPQVRVGSYRIDMVVEGDNDERLAIECDGDRFHGPAQWESDMRRQRILERAGWEFWRCFASTFIRYRADTIKNLESALQARGIMPLSSEDVPTDSSYVEFRRVLAFEPNRSSKVVMNQPFATDCDYVTLLGFTKSDQQASEQVHVGMVIDIASGQIIDQQYRKRKDAFVPTK
nr:hypothetical protein [Tanacetum cinerariifolium]